MGINKCFKCLLLKIPEEHNHIVIQFYASIIKCTAMPNLSRAHRK